MLLENLRAHILRRPAHRERHLLPTAWIQPVKPLGKAKIRQLNMPVFANQDIFGL